MNYKHVCIMYHVCRVGSESAVYVISVMVPRKEERRSVTQTNINNNYSDNNWKDLKNVKNTGNSSWMYCL